VNRSSHSIVLVGNSAGLQTPESSRGRMEYAIELSLREVSNENAKCTELDQYSFS
jgi:hypothetical protein